MRLHSLLLALSALSCATPTPNAHDLGPKRHLAPEDQFAPIPAAEIVWRGPLGHRASEPRYMYTLMTRGGFRAPTSAEFDSLVRTWHAAHPTALAQIVHVLQPMMADDPHSQSRAVWVVDGTSNLNLELVRAGACPGGTMEMPEFGKQLVDSATYVSFVREIQAVEIEARRERRGIWAEHN